MLRRGPDTHRRLARPFAAPRPYRADLRRKLPPQGQAKSRKFQSKKLEFGTPGWVSFTPTIPTKVGQISTGVDSYAGPLHRGGHLRQYELHRHVESYSFSFGPSPFNFWPPRPRNSGYYDLC